MRNQCLARAFSLWAQTLPFLPWRLGLVLLAAVTLALAVMLGLAGERMLLPEGGLGGLDGLAGGLAGLVVWLVGQSVMKGLGRVSVPHAAAMVARIDGQELPEGQAQVAAAQALVRARFGRSRDLARLARLLRSLVRGIASLIDEGVDADQVGPATGPRAWGLRLYRRLAAGPVSEVILGHALREGDANGWDRAHDAAVLLAQNSALMLAVAGRLILSGWLVTGIVALALLEPLALASAALGVEGGAYGPAAVLALGLAWSVKAILIDPVILGSLLQLFLTTTEEQAPNAEWRGLLAHALPAFRKLAEGAGAWRPGPSALVLGDA